MDKLHYFVLHPDGKIYLRGKFATDDIETEVSNQKDVFAKMAWHGLTPLFDEVFPLQCHVEKKEQRRYRNGLGVWSQWYSIEPYYAERHGEFQARTVAHVTFSEPSAGVEETQEERFTRIDVVKILESYADHVYKGHYVHKYDVEGILETLSPSKIIDEFLTRKNK